MRVKIDSGFALFRPPYDGLQPCDAGDIIRLQQVSAWKGVAAIWHLGAGGSIRADCECLEARASGLPLLILLPPPDEVHAVAEYLPRLRVLAPRLILPYGLLESTSRLRQVFAIPPQSLGRAVIEHLVRRGLLRGRVVMRELQRTFELAPHVHSIGGLARRLYTSRRTLGRHFAAANLPVPSHCLQFARLLHAAIALQTCDEAAYRVAVRHGYSDGFTLSNQMKRFTGHRPSEVRTLLGWEWIVESWLESEGVG